LFRKGKKVPHTYSKSLDKLPASVQGAVRFIALQLNPESIILFGSRARGDHRSTSDVDLAIRGISKPENWSSVVLSLDEDPHSLFKIDLLNYEEMSDTYRKDVDTEGIVIYGRNP
jgi:uncharacterized protein